MDKKLNRQILFDKKAGAGAEVKKKESKKEGVPPKEGPQTPPRQPEPQKRLNQSERIVKWIKSHEFFKWSTMVESLGIDRGNFSRTIYSDTPIISEEVQVKIVAILKDYGYAE